MRNIIVIYVLLAFLQGCSSNDGVEFTNDISEFQDVWRDTIYDDNNIFIEDLIVKGNSLEYILTNAETYIICDKLSGMLTVGNENKIGWNCISSITNQNRQLYWNVLAISNYKMKLYSDLHGERNFRKVYYPSKDECHVPDTMSEMFYYKDFLPLHKDDLLKKFGTYNRLVSKQNFEYLTNLPLFSTVCFKENVFNDSVYSYSLSYKKRDFHNQLTSLGLTKLRGICGITEYTDGKNLKESNIVISVDTTTQIITCCPIIDYNLWPDVTHFLGKPIQDAKHEYEGKYIYTYHEKNNEYDFETSHDSIFNVIGLITDTSSIIKCVGIEMFNYFKSKAEAKKECEEIAAVFKRKYNLESYDDTKDLYQFTSGNFVTKSSYSIQLLIKRYQQGMGIYRIQIIYKV